MPLDPSQPTSDPSVNFTLPQTQPAGMRVPEFAICQLIGWALDEVRKKTGTPEDVIDQVFAFVPQLARDQFKQWLRDNQNIYIDVSWPRDPVHLALVVVEPQSEAEDTSNTFLGDRVGTTDTGQLGGQVPFEAPAYGIPETRTTNVYVGSDHDRMTLLLYELIKFIIVSNKAGLEQFYDVHNLSLSGGVLEDDNDKRPTFAYNRVLQLRYLTIFDYNGPSSGPAVVNLILSVATFAGGVETDTVVEGA